MDKLLVVLEMLEDLYLKLKHLSIKLYNKLCFLFNKQLTIQKMYEPITANKVKAADSLAVKLAKLKLENNRITNNNEKLIKENKVLLEKISILQELLIKK
jgi:hypothetical protein